jgi:hypothetical protein
MCPLYVAGLIGPGDRKSVAPLAERFAPGDYDQLHHFVAAGVWEAAPLEAELLVQADKLVGGSEYPRPAFFVDNRVYLAVSPALGDTYRLRLGPPLSRRQRNGGFSHGCCRAPPVQKYRDCQRPQQISPARCRAHSSGQSDCRLFCAVRIRSGSLASGSQPAARA